MANLIQAKPDFTRTLQRWADRIASGRVIAKALVEGEQAKKALRMSDNKVLIKGLSEQIAAAKKAIAEAKLAPAALHKATVDLVATCGDLTKQVNDMHEDLKFEATQLGNSGETSAESEKLNQSSDATLHYRPRIPGMAV